MKLYFDTCKLTRVKNTLLRIYSDNQLISEGLIPHTRSIIIEVPYVKDIRISLLIIDESQINNYECYKPYEIYDSESSECFSYDLHKKFNSIISDRKLIKKKTHFSIPKEWIYIFDTKIHNITTKTDSIFISIPPKNKFNDDIVFCSVLNEDLKYEYICNLNPEQLKSSFRQWIPKWIIHFIMTLIIGVVAFLGVIIDIKYDYFLFRSVVSLLIISLIIPGSWVYILICNYKTLNGFLDLF